MWWWHLFVCKYLRWGVVKWDWGERWGAQLRLFRQIQPLFTSQMPVTHNSFTTKYTIPESCQSLNLKAPTLQRGRRGEGSKVNCRSLGWNFDDDLCSWCANSGGQADLGEALTAEITINLSSSEHGEHIWLVPQLIISSSNQKRFFLHV